MRKFLKKNKIYLDTLSGIGVIVISIFALIIGTKLNTRQIELNKQLLKLTEIAYKPYFRGEMEYFNLKNQEVKGLVIINDGARLNKILDIEAYVLLELGKTSKNSSNVAYYPIHAFNFEKNFNRTIDTIKILYSADIDSLYNALTRNLDDYLRRFGEDDAFYPNELIKFCKISYVDLKNEQTDKYYFFDDWNFTNEIQADSAIVLIDKYRQGKEVKLDEMNTEELAKLMINL